MTIKKIIGWTIIAFFWIGMIYFYATQVPWYAILIGIGGLTLFTGGMALVIWLISDPKAEDNKTENNMKGLTGGLEKYRFPFRVGRKQKRALLDADGLEIVIFPIGNEEIARITCDMWNDWHKELCKSWGDLAS